MPARRVLGQIIAVEKQTRQKDNAEGSRLKNAVQRQSWLTGLTKTYKPDDEDAPESEQIDPQYTNVHLRAEDVLEEAVKYSVPAMDVTATKDRTNQDARADLIVNGTVLVPDVPVSHLLWLEHYLTEWKGFLTVLPVLPPEREWSLDHGRGLYMAVPEFTERRVKETVPLVLVPATKEHPAQALPQTAEKRAGKYTTVHLSGAVTEDRKKQLLDRMHVLQLAVKDAVTRANRTEVTEVTEGHAILGWLLTGGSA